MFTAYDIVEYMLQRARLTSITKGPVGWCTIAFTALMLLMVSTFPVGVSAAGTPYGSGTYNSGSYNSTGTSGTTASAPNTGAGLYSPGQTSTQTSRTVNWLELAGGAVLVIAGVGGFWFLAVRKHQ